MKRLLSLILAAALLAGCTAAPAQTTESPYSGANFIDFVDDGTVGVKGDGVTLDEPIVYYEAGKDFTYGEGEAWEAHTPEEAAEHTVVTITKPGTYVLSGKLHGQVAVDLGEDAAEDPNAVVTLVLSGVDITCTVAPAVIFYNVYECGSTDDPKADVDTSAAGANVILAAGSENVVNGSHVARIYKPESVVLSEDGTEVTDSKKLHKYDGAFYSCMTMNVDGDGKLTIHADNEGMDSEMHLTVNGGDIAIFSGNDGINTNEDGVSVTIINGGSLTVTVTGETGEGDGIDSNGWLVINGGSVQAWACGTSGDAGIDADMGVQLNGGTILTSGNMLDKLEGSQNFAVFTFAQTRKAGEFSLKNEAGETVLTSNPVNSFGSLVFSSPELTEGTYTLWAGDVQLQGAQAASGGMGFAGPVDRPDWPDRGDKNDPPPDVEIPPQPTQPLVTQGMAEPPAKPDGEPPEGFQMPEGQEPPEGFQMPEGQEPPMGFAPSDDLQPPEGGFQAYRPPQNVVQGAASTEFQIQSGANYFANVTEAA